MVLISQIFWVLMSLGMLFLKTDYPFNKTICNVEWPYKRGTTVYRYLMIKKITAYRRFCVGLWLLSYIFIYITKVEVKLNNFCSIEIYNICMLSENIICMGFRSRKKTIF